MKGSLKIATIRDVPVNLHWTFFLFMAFLAFLGYSFGDAWRGAFYAVAIILLVFFFVLVHELAHVATARRYGVATRAITLHPLGGISMMEQMPERPRQEAAVAAVGPATNLVWAVLLAPLVWHVYGPASLYQPRLLDIGSMDLLRDMYWINIIMGVFNLLPAFPLDGGRVMRASLASRMNHVRATKVAADLGRFFGILFVLAGFMIPGAIMLSLIGVFVYFGAAAEERSATTMALFRHATVREAMRTEFEAVAPDLPVSELVEISYRTHQMDLPVLDGDRYVGLVDRNTMSSALGLEGHTAGDLARGDLPRLVVDDDLATAFRHFSNARVKALPVLEPPHVPPSPVAAAGDDPSQRAAAGLTASGKVSWAKVPGEDLSGARLVGLLTMEDMERAFLYIAQRERYGRDTRIASPVDHTPKRRLPRARDPRVSREPSDEVERWVPVRE